MHLPWLGEDNRYFDLAQCDACRHQRAIPRGHLAASHLVELAALDDGLEQVLGRDDRLALGVRVEASFRLFARQRLLAAIHGASLAGLAAYSADYRKGAEAYSGSTPIIQKLRGETRPVTVKVYFGSWCNFCKQMVPRIMHVAEQLKGSKINIDFYGLPHDIHSDRQAESLGISAVPTGVVYLEGKEVGRISGNGWKIPELAINNALTKAGSS